MKKILRLLILFAIASLSVMIISCEQKNKNQLVQPLVLKDGLLYKDSTSTTPYTGRHKSSVLDKIIEYEVKDGIKNGEFILYFPNGKIEMKGYIVNDKNQGEWKYYFPDGTLQTVGFFKDDVPDSTWTWYYQSGKVFEVGIFDKGIRKGEWKTFDENGTLRVSRIFKDGVVKDSTVFN